MAYDSYKVTRKSSSSNPRQQMLDEKKEHVKYYYELAVDRKEGCSINGRKFIKSPRIFEQKSKLVYFHMISVITIEKNDKFNSGDILFYDDHYWICVFQKNSHFLHCKGTFIRTNYLLKWQNSSGEIIKRYCHVQSAAQYNSGEYGNKTITLGSDQLMVILPSDNETNILATPKRIFVDKKEEKPIPYKITRNDNVPYSDWDYGCVNLIMTQDVLRGIDNIQLGICDYIPPVLPPHQDEDNNLLTCEIIYKGNPTIIAGGNEKTFTAVFRDENGNEVDDIIPLWSIDALPSINGYIETELLDDCRYKVKIKYATEIIGSFFNINLSDNNGNTFSQEIEIGGAF